MIIFYSAPTIPSSQPNYAVHLSIGLCNLRYFHNFRKASFYLAGGLKDQINGDITSHALVIGVGVESSGINQEVQTNYSIRIQSEASSEKKEKKTHIVSSYQPMQCNNRDYSSRGD